MSRQPIEVDNKASQIFRSVLMKVLCQDLQIIEKFFYLDQSTLYATRRTSEIVSVGLWKEEPHKQYSSF